MIYHHSNPSHDVLWYLVLCRQKKEKEKKLNTPDYKVLPHVSNDRKNYRMKKIRFAFFHYWIFVVSTFSQNQLLRLHSFLKMKKKQVSFALQFRF